MMLKSNSAVSFTPYRPTTNQLNVNAANKLYATSNIDINDWTNHCKSSLIKMESVNIQTRSTHWSNIVNSQTHRTNHCIHIDTTVTPYKYECNPSKHLNFLQEWQGLKMRQITNYPRTYNEFQAKAKNWLNGRRAPNYGSTLFPDMIKTAEKYANNLAHQFFADNDGHRKLYFSVLMYAYLAALCSERITMNNASKRTPLLLENSLKYCKTPTAKLLQNYAQDYPYPLQFPSHLRQAADFFHTKYDNFMNRIYVKQNDGEMTVSPNFKIDNKATLRLNMLDTVGGGDNNKKDNKKEKKVVKPSPIKRQKEPSILPIIRGETSSHSSDNGSMVYQQRKKRKISSKLPPLTNANNSINYNTSSSSNSTISTLSVPNSMNMQMPYVPVYPQMATTMAPQNQSIADMNLNQSVVQLTSSQYGALLSKIENLESSQLQQRRVIACLAGKLQDLEHRNIQNQIVIPPLPQLPQIMPSSVPMTEPSENAHFMPGHNIMPSIDSPNSAVANYQNMEFHQFAHFNDDEL